MSQFIKTGFTTLLATLSVTFALVTFEAITLSSKQAVAQATDAPTRKSKRIESINTSWYGSTQSKIQEAYELEDYDVVNRLLNEVEADPESTDLEKAYAANYRGNLCFAQDDLECALAEFKKVLALRGSIPEGFYNHMLYVVAQIQLSQEEYQGALQYAQSWFETQADPSSDAFILIGQAHYMLEEYDKALPNVISGIQQYSDLGRIPKEGWLNLLTAIYRKTDRFEKTVPVLDQLIEHYPKDTYRQALDTTYKNLNQTKSPQLSY